MKISELQECQDCRVVLRLHDGEMLIARVDFVDLEYDDVVVDVLETSNPRQYKGPKNAVYTIKAIDIMLIEKLQV